MSRKLLFFMHLPKCGGTTFHAILDRMYLPEEILYIDKFSDAITANTEEFISLPANEKDKLKSEIWKETLAHALPANEKDKLKLVKGHLEFGLHELFSANAEYITFLRDPIERIVSFYYWLKRQPTHRLYKFNLFNNKMSLYDFVTKINAPDINNGQIRFISGIEDKEELMLSKALENIKEYFSFVGTLEKFDESLTILQKMYGWSTPYYKINNKTDNRPGLDVIDEKTIDAIKYYNAGDIALYKQMRESLEAKLENMNSLRQDLLRLKILSRAHFFKDDVKNYASQLMPAMFKNAVKRILH